MVCLGSHKKFGATGVQGWNGKKRGPNGDINRIPENSECPVEELRVHPERNEDPRRG